MSEMPLNIDPVEADIDRDGLKMYSKAIKGVVSSGDREQAAQIVSVRIAQGAIFAEIPSAFARVLIVEDDPRWKKMHENSAKRVGHNVDSASSAEEALTVINNKDLDYVVTDGLKGDWKKVCKVAQGRGCQDDK